MAILHSFIILTQLIPWAAWSAGTCVVAGPDFTAKSYEYQETFLDMERQVQYAKKTAVTEALVAAGIDPKIAEFIPQKSMAKLSESPFIDTNAAVQIATNNGYKPTRALIDSAPYVFAMENTYAKGNTPVAPATHVYEVDGVKITMDVADYSKGTFKTHPKQEMNSHPRQKVAAKLDPDVMIKNALTDYKKANPAGVPLSTGDNPVFYRVVNRGELLELLGTGQSRANGSITDWTKDFMTPREKKWLEENKIYVTSARNLSHPTMGKYTPAQIATLKADFKSKFGRELPAYFETQAEIKGHFVTNLKRGLANETSKPGLKERLPAKTKELMQSFTHNGVLDEAALGRYVEDKVLSLPAGAKRNDALLDLYGYDFSAQLHADPAQGFDQYSPFKGTSIGMPMSSYINNDTYLIAIRDIHGRARKNIGNGAEREWFYKDGIALDEVAGIWSPGELTILPNGPTMFKSPEKMGDPAWDPYVLKDYKQNIGGDPEPIIRPMPGTNP